MGHAKVTTTLSIYTHLFDHDHSDAMAALDAVGLYSCRSTRGQRDPAEALVVGCLLECRVDGVCQLWCPEAYLVLRQDESNGIETEPQSIGVPDVVEGPCQFWPKFRHPALELFHYQ